MYYIVKDDALGRYTFLKDNGDLTYEYEKAASFTDKEADAEVRFRNRDKILVYRLPVKGFQKNR